MIESRARVYSNLRPMRPDLDPLRARPDFQLLMLDLAIMPADSFGSE
jgi:hypothetical protein